MAEIPVLRIETLEDLKKVLFLQRQITRKAHDELEAVASDNVLDADPDPAKVKKFMKEESELLASYAIRPTLTEWAYNGGISDTSLYGGSQTWGATFAVAILTSELILEQIRAMHPQYVHAIKSVFLQLLAAETQMKTTLDEGELENITMKFNVMKPDGTPIDDEGVKKQIHVGLNDLVSTIVATGLEYGIFEDRGKGAHIITNLGVRVMLHMQDTLRFVLVMAEAHKKFQSEAPALMNSLAETPEPSRRKRRIKPNNTTT
jgi:hypothetical protein